MTHHQRLRALLGFVWGFLLFLGVAWSLRFASGLTTRDSPVMSQVVLKTVLVLIALIGWKLCGGSLSEMGCAGPTGGTGRTLSGSGSPPPG